MVLKMNILMMFMMLKILIFKNYVILSSHKGNPLTRETIEKTIETHS